MEETATRAAPARIARRLEEGMVVAIIVDVVGKVLPDPTNAPYWPRYFPSLYCCCFTSLPETPSKQRKTGPSVRGA